MAGWTKYDAKTSATKGLSLLLHALNLLLSDHGTITTSRSLVLFRLFQTVLMSAFSLLALCEPWLRELHCVALCVLTFILLSSCSLICALGPVSLLLISLCVFLLSFCDGLTALCKALALSGQ